jgi:signal transduction histidine kinase
VIAAGLLTLACLFSLWSALDAHARLRNAARAARQHSGQFSAFQEAVAADARSMRRVVFVDLGVLALALVFAAASVRRRRRSGEDAEAQPALKVYEEAMGRLLDQHNRRDAAHRDEVARLAETLADKEAMARAGELTAGMAHEVRNSLQTIQGYARLLQGESLSDDASAATRAILRESETLQSMVRAFVDFIKRDELVLTTVDLRRLLSTIVAREAKDGPIVAIRENLEEAFLSADNELLERAFGNLVRNAREAAGPNGRVDIEWRRLADRINVVIADDGHGLATNDVPGRPFVTTKAGGLGLGLATAIKIVRLHGGSLVLENRPGGKGCAARVELPTVE